MAVEQFSPNTLRSTVNRRGGFATSEKFQVFFQNPPVTLTDLTYLCENVALPTKSISGVDKLIYGVNYQMPYRQAFPEIAMTFYCTKYMEEKQAFDRWQNTIINPTNGDLSFYEDYTCNITIHKFHKDAIDFTSPVYSIILEKAWPSIVAEIQLSHSQGNEITRLPVTFQYKKWVKTIAE
tara:strand:+ start:206 stop:745 length:540 start_codon:yes stop_codon:yes gene_type:complete